LAGCGAVPGATRSLYTQGLRHRQRRSDDVANHYATRGRAITLRPHMTQPTLEQRDLTAQLWRAFFENASVGIIISTNHDYRFVTTNVAFQQMLGYTEDELGHLTYLDVTVPEDREMSRLVGKELAEGVRKSLGFEKRYRHKDGRIVWVNVSGNVIPGATEGSTYFAAIVQDITERKRAEDALRAAQTELAHVTRVTALGELAASIAHEVNQPLGAIIADANACLNWLAADPPDLVNVREALIAVVKDGARAADVITRIRALLARSDIAHASCDLVGVVRDVLALVGSDLARQAVSVETSLAPGLPNVLADRIQIQQVLLNLLLNAAEASRDLPAQRRRILVCATLQEFFEGSCVVVAVRDAGIGFQGKASERVFDAFYTTKPNGLGMGLAISRSIIDSHGGRLWVTSNEDHGATFHFALPVLRWVLGRRIVRRRVPTSLPFSSSMMMTRFATRCSGSSPPRASL
jgi:PAS domain S-box-containing protein